MFRRGAEIILRNVPIPHFLLWGMDIARSIIFGLMFGGTMKPILAAILVIYLSSVCAEEVTLTLASSWNRQQNFTALFMKYIESVNEAGRGVVQIKYLGGPEVIPQRQLFYALRRGVVDMAFGGITYYRGILPEGDAIFASTITPMRARENGALDALQPYWEQRVNAHLIGWVQSGVGVNIYLTDPPRFDDNGMPDLSGLKIRTSPSNREILTRLGGRAIQIPVKEIYTSLQRGMVDGLAFTTTGMPDLGIHRFIRYRIDPAFLQLAMCLQMNLDRWNGLSPEAREILEAQADIYARQNRLDFFAIQDKELEFLEQQGLKAVPVPDGYADAYRSLAHEVVWDRLAAREPESAARLKPLFYPNNGKPEPGDPLLIRAYDRLIYGLAGLAGAMIAGVCLLIVYDVVARNLGLQPPRSTVALTEYALLYFTMAAAPYLVRVKGHIVVEVVYQRLGGKVQKHTRQGDPDFLRRRLDNHRHTRPDSVAREPRHRRNRDPLSGHASLAAIHATGRRIFS